MVMCDKKSFQIQNFGLRYQVRSPKRSHEPGIFKQRIAEVNSGIAIIDIHPQDILSIPSHLPPPKTPYPPKLAFPYAPPPPPLAVTNTTVLVVVRYAVVVISFPNPG